MKKYKVYIASPYTLGDVAVNVKNQIDCFSKLLDMGLTPFAPLLSHFVHMAHPKDYNVWMEQDLIWIKSCDFLLRLPGESSGADKEIEFAKKHGIPVYYTIEELFDGCISTKQDKDNI